MLVTSAPGEFYAMGFHGEGAALITPDKTWYYTDSRYIEAANAAITGAEVVMWTTDNNFRQRIGELVKAGGIKKLGFEDRYMSVAAATPGRRRWRPNMSPPPSWSPSCAR